MKRFQKLAQLLTLFAGLAGVFGAGILLEPQQRQFLTVANQRDVLSQVSINGILAVGMTLVILTGGIDLSVGSVMSLCTVVCAMLLMHVPGEPPTRAHHMAWLTGGVLGGLIGYWLWVRILSGIAGWRRGHPLLVGWVVFATGATLAGAVFSRHAENWSTWGVVCGIPLVGGLMGLLNGLVISRTRLQPFIVTLAMMIAAVGLAKYMAGQGGQIHPIYKGDADQAGAPESFERLGETILTVGQETLPSGRVRDLKILPVPGLFFVGCWALAAIVLSRLPIGRYIYAVGGSEEASRFSGLDVAGVKLFVYAASGALAGLAAVLYCAQYTQGKADAGQMKELDAIAAVVIGGTSLTGGRGSILGTFVGVLIFGYLSNILQLHAVSSEIQDILKGVIIVGAAALQSGNFSRWLRLK